MGLLKDLSEEEARPVAALLAIGLLVPLVLARRSSVPRLVVASTLLSSWPRVNEAAVWKSWNWITGGACALTEKLRLFMFDMLMLECPPVTLLVLRSPLRLARVW